MSMLVAIEWLEIGEEQSAPTNGYGNLGEDWEIPDLRQYL